MNIITKTNILKKMKDGFIHVCFVIDESGSMTGSESDVCGGFNKVIEEQKAVENGSCAVSVYRFATNVKKDFVGKPVSEIGKMHSTSYSFSGLMRTLNNLTIASSPFDVVVSEEYTNPTEETFNDGDLSYTPMGSTAMNDGIGTAIDEIGKWLSDMPEEERPEKNLIVIMTDGEENNSHKYSIEKVKEMIKHQAEVYNWSFVYMGTDISDSTYANDIMQGVQNCSMAFSDRDDLSDNYNIVGDVATTWRNMTGATYMVKCNCMNVSLDNATDELTTTYEKKIGKKIK